MNKEINIADKIISQNSDRVFIVAEMSGNHNGDINRAKEIIKKAKEAGADAVKIQTYTADTITLDCDSEYFQITQGTLWDGTTLHKLYQKAYTPWEWHEELFSYAKEVGIICFSSPFDLTAVDYLESLNVPAYKIASFEVNDIPLIRKVARTKKPIIISTGIAYPTEIREALDVCKQENNENVILLKCTSSYPTPYEDMNLKTINWLEKEYNCIVGLSDHSMGEIMPISAVSLGAKLIEKHMTLDREDGGVDSEFSMSFEEFKKMVTCLRNTENALGTEMYELKPQQVKSREHSRSLFVSKDIRKGEVFTADNIRSVRPAFGLHTRYYEDIIGKKATCDLRYGTPMEWSYVEE